MWGEGEMKSGEGIWNERCGNEGYEESLWEGVRKIEEKV